MTAGHQAQANRLQPLIEKGQARADKLVRKGGMGGKGEGKRQRRPEEVGHKDLLQFFRYEPAVLEAGVKDLVKEKSGNEHKKRGPAGDDVGQDPFRVGVEVPAAETVAMTDNNEDNGDATVIFK